MSKYLLSAAAAAFLMVGSSAAWADCPSGSEGLPNANWSWNSVGGGDPVVTTDTIIGTPVFSGSSGNAFADVTTVTTTTTPGFICQAVNPGGNVVDSKSFSTEPTVVVSDPVVETDVKVCQNTGGTGSVPLFDDVDCSK